MENDSGPLVTRRQSARHHVLNINHQEVLTLNEAAEVRSRLAEGLPYFSPYCHTLVTPRQIQLHQMQKLLRWILHQGRELQDHWPRIQIQT